jgi:hypothetical protein
MTTELSVPAPRRRAIDSNLRIELFHVLKLESHTSVTLPAIIVGLAGAVAIVYVTTRIGHTPALPAASEPDAIETTGVSLVK